MNRQVLMQTVLDSLANEPAVVETSFDVNRIVVVTQDNVDAPFERWTVDFQTI